MEGGEFGNIKIGAIIQARLGSKRLPNKVLLPLGAEGTSIIRHIFNTLNSIRYIHETVLATSTSKINDQLVQHFKTTNFELFRGSEDDVLSRFANIVRDKKYDYVLRFTGDNPIIDVKYLNQFVIYAINNNLDYCNTKNLPLGCNFEIMKGLLLFQANEKAKSSYEKEHVTPYIKENALKKDTFHFTGASEFWHNIRLTVDYPSDYAFINTLCTLLAKDSWNIESISEFLKSNKWLLKVNSNLFQKRMFADLKDEIEVILPIVDKMEMKRLKKRLLALQVKGTD